MVASCMPGGIAYMVCGLREGLNGLVQLLRALTVQHFLRNGSST
jgi:hypothetical protein